MNGKISNTAQICSVRRYTLSEGKSRGVEVIDCDNGTIRFLLNVSKALDVMQLYHKGQNISFLSKNAFVKDNLNFLRRFEGGMLYTCGLDSVGGREGHELHGNLHNIPANVISCYADETGVTVVAEIVDTALFGQNLVLCRTVTAAVGSGKVTVEDVLQNRAYRTENYCLLYHVNFGYPMLDAGATVQIDTVEVTPRNEWSAQNAMRRTVIGENVDNEDETAYFLKTATPKATLTNAKLGKEVTLSYSSDTLPCFVQWNSMASGDYALGFEPCTTYLDDKFAYQTLGAGETVKFVLNIEVKEI